MSFPRFVYYGTSDFSARILRGLFRRSAKPELVVTTAPKPSGRGFKLTPSPIAGLAKAQRLPYLELNSLKDLETQKQLEISHAPLAILAAFGKIIPPQVLALYPRGIINVHPSLLPLYRGPSPMQYAIKDRQKETGVSLIVLDNEVDHGPILAQVKYQITARETTVTLADSLVPLAVELLFAAIPSYWDNLLKPVEQDHSKATFTTMIKRADGQADFSQSAVELDAARRAFTPWPGLWTAWQDKNLKLLDTDILPDYQDAAGKVCLVNNQIVIACAQNGLIVNSLQREGGKVLSANDFRRGHRDFIGSVLK